jgi:hypothetical protein
MVQPHHQPWRGIVQAAAALTNPGDCPLRTPQDTAGSTDVPGSEQRFAKFRTQRNAQDLATQVDAERIRNRLASYFVAGT